jgi:short-subunit dehydrogenase
MTSLNGKRVLLTGGSRGVGPFIARALAKRGAKIALTARSEEGLQNVARSLRGFGVEAAVVPADLSEPAQRRDLVRAVLDAFGGIDVLINNAGLETEGAFLSMPWERLRETIEVNLIAPMELTHLLLPHMLDRKQGHIVHLASLAAKRGTPFDAVYSGTKAGLAEWTRGLRLELAGTGVRFSTIFPGYVTDVGMFAKFGLAPPWTIGSCTPSQVAGAVIRAVEHDRLEVIVNSRPVRPMIALGELFPSFGDWLMGRLGVTEFQRKKVSKLS